MAYNNNNKLKKAKFSYSRLNSFEACAWKYKLTYEDKHFFFSESVASLFGTLVHHTEEVIGNAIKDGKEIDYEKLKEEFITLNIPKTSPYDTKGGVFGINYIKDKFPIEFHKVDDNGESFAKKAKRYLDSGIYRLENYMKNNPDMKIKGTELHFEIAFGGEILAGDIDRVYENTKTGEYIIEDIKTKDKPFKAEELEVPLQFVIYTKALSSMMAIPVDKISCVYDLPFCEIKQPAGNLNFVKEGERRLVNIFAGIENKEFTPNPSPLCAYCAFSATNPHQPNEARRLCPFYSLWTPNGTHKAREVAHKWEGIDNVDKAIDEVFGKKIDGIDNFEFDF